MTAEDFNLPKQTHDIFAIMARGHFISSNGSRDNMGRLYDIINDAENFDRFQAYFNVIRYNIERGNNFFYFSKINEANSIIEKNARLLLASQGMVRRLQRDERAQAIIP